MTQELDLFFGETETEKQVNDIYSLSKKEQRELYDRAKTAYYDGEPIMSDADFDALEDALGLTNKSYIGAEASATSKKYTVKHAFKMGSLSKIQFRKDKKTGKVNLQECFEEWQKYLTNAKPGARYSIEPKLDGCSFEAIYEYGDLKSVSTRGDGDMGQDIEIWAGEALPDFVKGFVNLPQIVVRGEVLVDVKVFEEKYADVNANPRSFVASCLNSDWDESKVDIRKDLHFVCYDFRDPISLRVIRWQSLLADGFPFEFIPVRGVMDCTVDNITPVWLNEIYETMEYFRNHVSPYQLDGFVFKPAVDWIEFDANAVRPADCVAFKFLPEVADSEVIGIEWSLGKTGEYFPVAKLKPVQLMGTQVSKASLYNYEFVVANKVIPGAKVKIVKSGDIIPQIIEVYNTEEQKKNFTREIGAWIPPMSYVEESYSSNGKTIVRHLMKQLSVEERQKLNFFASGKVIGVPGVGPAVLNMLTELRVNNLIEIFEIAPTETIAAIIGGGAATEHSRRLAGEIHNRFNTLTLSEIIQSMNIPLCGKRVSEECAIFIMGGKPNFESMPAKAYEWVLNWHKGKEFASQESLYLEHLLNCLNFKMPEYKEDMRIPVILTGEPTAFGYKTKGVFLQQHPEFRLTTSWKEVQIVFTDDKDSNTGKMQKARKNNITIKTYGEA